jgi:hypothetical protein
MRYRFNIRRDFKTTQIGATKHVASIRRRGDEPDMNRDGSMESYTVRIDGTAERGLFDQMSGPLSQSLTHVSKIVVQPMCLTKLQGIEE